MTTLASRAPATGEILGEVASTELSGLDSMITRSRVAQRSWEQAGAVTRALTVGRLGSLLAAESGLAELLAAEVGKPIKEARAEVQRGVHICIYYAGVGHELGGILRNSVDPSVAVMARQIPIGVAGLITPWNFPLAIPLWKMIPGLVAGCSVIWKPAPQAVLVAERLMLLLRDAGVPEDLVQVAYGGAPLGAALGEQDLDALSFTGSAQVGATLRERLGRQLRPRLALELGGVNIAYVLADADLSQAAACIASAAFHYAGQKCTATQIVAAEANVHDDLVDALRQEVANLVVGDPLQEDVVVGPVIDSAAAAAVRAPLPDIGVELASGTELDGEAFVPPVMLAIDGPANRLAQSELFGPVLGIARVSSDTDRRRLAQASGMGLAAAIYSRDADAVRRTANLVGTGVVAVNRPSTGLDPHVPFGGWHNSGGEFPEQGIVGLDFFRKWQTIYWKSESPGAQFP